MRIGIFTNSLNYAGLSLFFHKVIARGAEYEVQQKLKQTKGKTSQKFSWFEAVLKNMTDSTYKQW